MGRAGEENQPGLALEAGANVGVELEVKFHNSAVNVMEPMVDRWPLTCEVRHGDGATSVVIQSDGRININVTPSSFRSIGDARAFFHALSTPSVPLYKPNGRRSKSRHSSEDDAGVGVVDVGKARDADKVGPETLLAVQQEPPPFLYALHPGRSPASRLTPCPAPAAP